jgi:RNA-directed DNA polymerase
MHDREKSDAAIVATKPTNKAGRPVAEPVERRAVAEGNADQQSTRRAQNRESVSQALDRIRKAFAVKHPRWEPYAGIPHVRICAGGAQ